jgi:TM2 domain-containing membrane protein YozV
MRSTEKPFKPMVAVAVVLAWIVPGAGHLYLRKRGRGLVIMAAIALTFWSGVAMGGAMTYYPEADWWWSVADMLTGVHGLAARQHHQWVYERAYDIAWREFQAASARYGNPAEPERQELLRQHVEKELQQEGLALVAPLDSVARAYSGVSGLLNVLCIIDAAFLAIMGRTGEPAPQAPPKREEPA